MRVLRDYHLHTLHLRCANETMTISAIIESARRRGLESIAVTDHLNERRFLGEHEKIRADLQTADRGNLEIFVGIELDVIPGRELPCDEGVMEKNGFQFAIGGPHGAYIERFSPSELVKVQHRLHLEAISNPLIDVLVHPWWFERNDFEAAAFPWFKDMSFLPPAVARELAAAAKQHNTAIEISSSAIFSNAKYPELFKRQYIDYLGLLAAEGAVFSTASDAHDISRMDTLSDLDDVVTRLGLRDSQLYHPSRGKRALRGK